MKARSRKGPEWGVEAGVCALFKVQGQAWCESKFQHGVWVQLPVPLFFGGGPVGSGWSALATLGKGPLGVVL